MTAERFSISPTGLPGVRSVWAQSGRQFPRHTHEEFGIGVILDGAQRSLSGRGMVEATAGDVITVNPGEVHDGVPIDGMARRWHMLYLDPQVTGAFLSDIRERDGTQLEFCDPVIRNPAIATRLARLLAMRSARPEDGLDEEAMLLLLGEVIGARTAQGPRTTTLARIQARIDEDPVHPGGLAELAHEAGLSRFRFLRAFADETGLTPHAYILQRRIDLARRLIAAGLPLASVAADAGFADQSHLTRHFTARYGISPGAYRKVAAPNRQ